MSRIKKILANVSGFLGFMDKDVHAAKHQQHHILFGGAAAGKVEHAVIVGTWVRLGKTQNVNITIHFEGQTYAPKLTPAVMDEIWTQARHVGIVPAHIYAYDNLSKDLMKRN